MSDNIPFEIQMEIIKWLPVKPLIQFKSVSKPWKSFIESSHFIKGYGARHTQPRSRILCNKSGYISLAKENYICLVEDDIGTLKVVGACHGLLCFYGWDRVYNKVMVVIWNPSIGKSFGTAPKTHDYWTDYGFGVCPVTKDPTLVKIQHRPGMPWYVEVFTLSSWVWNAIPSSNLPRQSIELNNPITKVIIDRFIYWGAGDMTSAIVVSFDLISKEFKVVDLPDILRNELDGAHVHVAKLAKLREHLVLYGSIYVRAACCVWVMEHDLSFRKLFIIGARVNKILGFSKSGETIFQIRKDRARLATLVVYDHCSQQIKNLGIPEVENSFFMGSYNESLLLLDHSDSNLHIHYEIIDLNDNDPISSLGFKSV